MGEVNCDHTTYCPYCSSEVNKKERCIEGLKQQLSMEDFSFWELVMIESGLRLRIKKSEREIDKRTEPFVPEEGKKDRSKLMLASSRSALEKLLKVKERLYGVPNNYNHLYKGD